MDEQQGQQQEASQSGADQTGTQTTTQAEEKSTTPDPPTAPTIEDQIKALTARVEVLEAIDQRVTALEDAHVNLTENSVTAEEFTNFQNKLHDAGIRLVS